MLPAPRIWYDGTNSVDTKDQGYWNMPPQHKFKTPAVLSSFAIASLCSEQQCDYEKLQVSCAQNCCTTMSLFRRNGLVISLSSPSLRAALRWKTLNARRNAVQSFTQPLSSKGSTS